ncbi:hypothetical protein PIB30_095051 [Stylosanthes scabra]|uniref:Uncharacterized protein n=1 Tax=Stylosanthes scabra TaxID=79078 RepID=A0ABU6QWN8_9FABA|nr:hypothetical protein [Stylosanthes scabra]
METFKTIHLINNSKGHLFNHLFNHHNRVYLIVNLNHLNLVHLKRALEKLTLKTSEFVQTTNNFIEEARANFRNQNSAIRNLETQVGQIAKQLSTPLPNAFPSNTQVNPKGNARQ